MIRWLSKTTLKLCGWKLEVNLPEEKKFILIGAPHTSNWDFPLGMLVFGTLDIEIKWVAKIQMFRGPLHYFFSALGGIPVDRSSSHGFISQIADQFNQNDAMVLTIAPEGTRSKTEFWKSGFYHIATTADVPICLGYIDYSKRTLGFSQMLYPSGNITEDMKIIADFYQEIKGKRPENQGAIRVKNQES